LFVDRCPLSQALRKTKAILGRRHVSKFAGESGRRLRLAKAGTLLLGYPRDEGGRSNDRGERREDYGDLAGTTTRDGRHLATENGRSTVEYRTDPTEDRRSVAKGRRSPTAGGAREG
jgi:hypothetical protein